MNKTILMAAMMAGLAVMPARAEDGFTYWSMWNEGEPQQKVLAHAIADFTAETGIEVDVQWVGRDIHKKIGPTLNSPETPFTLVDGERRKIYSSLVTTDSQASMEGVYASQVPGEDVAVEEALLANVKSGLLEDGEAWMVPYILLGTAWWFDAARMPELVGNEPATWEEMITLFSARKNAGHEVIAQDGDIGFYNLWYFTEIAVDHLGPGKVNAAIEDRSGEALRDPRILRTAEQIEELVDAGFFAQGYDSSKWPAQQQLWASGEVDFIYNGSWLPSETGDFLPEGALPWSFMMPAVSDEAINTHEVGVIGFAISDKGPSAEAAEKFVAWFLQTDYLAELAEKAKVLVPREGIEVAEVLEPVYQALNSGALTHNSYDGVNTYNADYTTKVLTPLVNELIFGQVDAQEFQQRLVDETVLYWELRD